MVANQFEVARKRAEQQSRAGLQQQQEALKRRFASMGAVSSGARMKAEQVASEKSQEQLQGAMEGIGAAEQQEQQRVGEIEQQRQFAKAEREAGQEFAGKQAELGRQFAIQERQAQEAFAGSQAEKNLAFQKQQFDWQQTQAGKEYDLAFQQFLQDKESTELNRRMAIAQARREGIAPEELGAPAQASTSLAPIGGLSSQEGSMIDSLMGRVESGKASRKELNNMIKTLSPSARSVAKARYAAIVKRRQAEATGGV